MLGVSILVIDDEEKMRRLLTQLLTLEGYEVHQAANAREGLKKLSQQPADVVLCDVKLPDGNGVSMAADIRQQYPLTEVILLTAYGTINDGVQAIRNGAFDYLVKGDDNNRIIPLIQRAVEKVQLARRVHALQSQVDKKYSFEQVEGSSPAIKAAVSLARKVAVTDTTVLLLGETGSGKEVFARSVHHAGKRSSKPFVAINCSAFGQELLESEMFGHSAGAFTGALKSKKGLFEEAHGGTIFLDEVGEMSASLQAKLLRVLETGEFIRVGETRVSKTDVRIIAATHRNLKEEVQNGHFREDLFYRLSVFVIQLPALRERQDDIESLVNYFAQVFAAKTNKQVRSIEPAFIAALKKHSWPGNIRELKNVIERSVILCERDTLSVADLPAELVYAAAEAPGASGAFDLALAEQVHIRKVLGYTKGNKAEAARLLNIGLTTLYRKLDEK